MSGGSLDYCYYKVEDAARRIAGEVASIECPKRKAKWAAFAKHVWLIATALHDVEWVISSDYGEDGADEAIDAVISNKMLIQEATAQAREIHKLLGELLGVASEN